MSKDTITFTVEGKVSPEMGRCKGCRWWGKRWNDHCPIRSATKYRSCRREFDFHAKHGEGLLGVAGVGGQDWRSAYTGPYFGCIHWEPKE